MRWLERLRRPGTPPAPDPLAEAQAAFSRGEYATALGLWEPLARAGAVEAQAGIGLCFLPVSYTHLTLPTIYSV